MAKPLKCVQLKSRHWIIRNAKGDLIDEMVGDGVVGTHPVLHAGMAWHLCSHLEMA